MKRYERIKIQQAQSQQFSLKVLILSSILLLDGLEFCAVSIDPSQND